MHREKITYPPLIQSIINRDWHSFCALVETADVNEKSSDGSNAIIKATLYSKDPICLKMFHKLLEREDLLVDQPNTYGLTALSVAAAHHWEVMEPLLQKGANPNTQTIFQLLSPVTMDHGNQTKTWRSVTPAALAAYRSNVPMFDLLNKYHADMNIIGSLDITPLSMTARNDDIDMMRHILNVSHVNVNILPENWQEITPHQEDACPVAIRKALKYGRATCVDYLLKHGSLLPKRIYRTNGSYATPLTYVLDQAPILSYASFHCQRDYFLTAQILLKNRDCHIAETDSKGRTALSLAAEKGAYLILDKVYASDLINKEDHIDMTPLGYAAINKKHLIVDWLLKKGANPNCTVYDLYALKNIRKSRMPDKMPLVQYAIISQDFSLLDKLLTKGVNLLIYGSAKQLKTQLKTHHVPQALQDKALFIRLHQEKRILNKTPHPFFDKLLSQKTKHSAHSR